MTSTALKLRRSPAVTVAVVIVMIAMLMVLSWVPVLLVLEVVPLAVAIWAWRSGTDVDEAGLTVHALLGRRRVPWTEVSGLVADDRGQVSAQLAGGRALPLPAVTPADLPRLVRASGHELATEVG